LTSIINGAPIERKGVRAQHPVMRPDESIEDVLEQTDRPRRCRGSSFASIKELGVLMPVIAVRNPDRTLLVREGIP